MNVLFPRCQVIPLPDDQVSIRIDGTERTRWHYSRHYPRPFFYPFNGPSGEALTRMGHPGAANHDHHRSIWFAHAKVLGIDFWSDNTQADIRQKHWLVYQDGDEQAMLATRLDWHDGHEPQELLTQIVIAVFRPGDNGETLFEIQTEFIPQASSLEFQQTNFGFLAVRVAKSIAEHFGSGHLTNSEGLVGEKDAGASVCMDGPLDVSRKNPLRLRFLLHAHSGPANRARADALAAQFAKWPEFEVVRSARPHQQYEIAVRS